MAYSVCGKKSHEFFESGMKVKKYKFLYRNFYIHNNRVGGRRQSKEIWEVVGVIDLVLIVLVIMKESHGRVGKKQPNVRYA